MKALLPIILLIISCHGYGQDSTKVNRKPPHKFSIGLVGGTVVGMRFLDLNLEYDFISRSTYSGLVFKYHFTKHSTLLFQPSIYNIHTTEYSIMEGNIVSGIRNTTRILLPVYYDLYNTNPLQGHIYAGFFYSNVLSYKGKSYHTDANGNRIATNHNYLTEYNYKNTGRVGFSIGTGISYSYKRFELGAQVLYMVGFGKKNNYIERENGYAPVNAMLAYSFK